MKIYNALTHRIDKKWSLWNEMIIVRIVKNPLYKILRRIALKIQTPVKRHWEISRFMLTIQSCAFNVYGFL